MRIEPVIPTARAYDRRQGGSDRRASTDRRNPSNDRRRARCTAAPWLSAPFATQLIDQCLFDVQPDASAARAAYDKANKAR